MDLKSKEGLYKTISNKTSYYFYVTENTGYELIGNTVAIGKNDIVYRLGRVLTGMDLRDKSSVWHSMEESSEYEKIIKSLFEKEVL